jgi:cell division protein ZapA
MGHISVTINGRQYGLVCEDSLEAHLLRLAKDLDLRINEQRAKFGEIGDMRLTVMAALTIADELTDAGMRLRRLEAEVAALQDARMTAADRAQQTQVAIASVFNSAAERIERVAKSLNDGVGTNGVGLG